MQQVQRTSPNNVLTDRGNNLSLFINLDGILMVMDYRGVTQPMSDYIASSSSGLPYTVARTGEVIAWDNPAIYNSPASPTSTALINDLVTTPKIGIVQKIYLNSASLNPFPAGWVRIGAAEYVPSVLNIIFATWVSGTRIEYWLTREI